MENKTDYSSIESFELKNIKGFVDSGTLSLKPITLFVGENSSGKSSTLRFPAVLAQTFLSDSENPIHFFGKYVDYGVFNEIVHQKEIQNKGKTISFELTVRMPFDAVAAGFSSRPVKEEKATAEVTITKDNDVSPLYVSNFVLKYGQLLLFELQCSEAEIGHYTIISYRNNNKVFVRENIAVSFDHFLPCFYFDSAEEEREKFERIALEKKSQLEKEERVSALTSNLEKLQSSIEKLITRESFIDEEDRKLGGLGDYLARKKADNLGQIKKLTSEIEEVTKELDIVQKEKEAEVVSGPLTFRSIREAANGFRARCKAAMEKVFYIGPFRMGPSRTYRDPEFRIDYVGASGENVSNFLVSAHHANPSFLKKVSAELKELLGYSIKVKNIGNGFFQLKVSDGFTESNLMDSGYGLSMVLPIIAQTMYGTMAPGASDNDKKVPYMTLIEQPELHLHPAAQSRLAEFFADCAEKAPNNKILIETHSEHLIRKLQVLVASKNCRLTSDMVKIYYVKKDSEGEAYVMDMHMREDGTFENEWPKGFFDNGYRLSMELLSANENS